jgi:broad specificity phosphatase PhoE
VDAGHILYDCSYRVFARFAKRCSDWFETDVVPLTTAGHARILVVSHGAFLSVSKNPETSQRTSLNIWHQQTLFQLFLLPKAKGGRFGFAAESDIRLGICANTSISIIRLDSDGEGRIISYNDMQHILPNEDVAGRDLAA